ncbi:glycosyltransferase family 4 protein [Pseudomonas sp. ISL-84]|nr:glycosyltransferase family 4 protein [Pseudomonas sp. ISL-84]
MAAAGELDLPYVDQKFNIPIQRSPFKRKNIGAYKQLKGTIDRNQYKIIHCHTPMGGVLARLAARSARKHGTKVIYTAHGFHFCKGAPPLNWLIYYPIERTLARLTDCLITINDEDYNLAVKHGFKAKQIEHVHGVGVDINRFCPVKKFNKSVLRAEYGYKDDDFLLFYAAEFNKNKNQKLLIQALSHIKENVPNAKLLLAGEGPMLQVCRNLAEQLGIAKMINFLGFRNDVELLLKMSDIAVGSSFREGLPVNIMEAMASGLPVVVSSNRGHSELIQNGINGYTISPKNYQDFGLRILEIYQITELSKKMGIESRNKVKKFAIDQVSRELQSVYSTYMAEEINESKSKHNRAYI